MTIRIGANPIGWSNDDLQDVGGATPLETCLAEAKEAGFTGMELGHKFPREPAALKAALAPYGMACVGGWHSVELLRRDAREEFALAAGHRALLKAMGTDVFIVAETSNAIHGDRSCPLSRRPVMAAADWGPFCARMTDLAKMLADEGLITAKEANGRKTYSLTKEGQAEAKSAAAAPPWQENTKRFGAVNTALPKAGVELAQAAAQVGRSGTAEQVDEAVKILEEARRKLYTLLAQG